MSDHEAGNPRSDPAVDNAAVELTPERWQKIKELLLAAQELDASDRDNFLREACGSDQALRAEVESLLALDDSRVESGLSTTGLLRETGLSSAAADPMVGRRVGAYEIVRQIGQGGMAVVYLAVRADDAYRKQVAVKLVRLELDSAEVLNRFRNERQMLAGLDHPNIVRLIDGGSTSEGLPYLVMDYVEGTPIDEYCDSHELPIEQRLRLFCTVCAAVQYAHQSRVIHRDLKPSNILVTAEGVPKLLDFGIAKVLHPDPSEQTLLVTQTGTRRMTPAYASPEQVRGEPVTPASDVYSLGVVLYELLTGRRPYRLKQTTPAEMERAICEQEPENPSTAVNRVETETFPDGTTVNKNPESVSKTREGKPEKLRRRLRGDLDTIVLMALHKEPQRRYASVEELSKDIERHLDHLPVKARRSTLGYRTSKFVRRHKAEVAAGVSIVVLLAIALLLAPILGYQRNPLPQPKVNRFIQITDDGRQKNGADFLVLIPSPYVSDGNNLYFTEMIDGSLALAQVPVTGGEPVPIATPFKGVLIGDFSPARSEFLLFKIVGTEIEMPVWVMPLAGGPARRVGDFLATSATWSPDGRQVLYTHSHDLYICKPDGSSSRKVASVSALPLLPRLSPKGDVVRFTQYNPQNSTSSLWEVSIDGSKLRPLFPDWADTSTCCGDWMADGRYFVFRAIRERRFEIWIKREYERSFRSVDSGPVQLTTGPIEFYNPGVSKDGRTLFAMGRQRRTELQRFDWHRSEFVPYLKGISAQVSIVGNRLAYVTIPEGVLWSSAMDGGQRLQLSSPPLVAEFPTISPDGQQVAFMAAAHRGILHIYSVPIHGGDPQQLSFGDTPEAYPDWSPDGNQLVFSGLPPVVTGNAGATPIKVLDLRTHRTSPIPGSDGFVCPRWSPEGRYLAAKSADSKRLMLYEFRNQRWTELATPSINFLNWSHNGKYIYFNTVPGEAMESAIYRVQVTRWKIGRMTDLKGLRQATGLWSEYWIGLAPDDSPLILRDIGSQEIYALDLQLP
jgi:serine/threonine protein kinase/Tol biopolymer transport system component